MMKRYTILKTVMLTFINPQDSYDVLFGSEDGVTLESDGFTIWIIERDGKRTESTMVAIAIDFWLRKAYIAEIANEQRIPI